ncbi:MAG: phosphatidate cytidylyltransferase [Puniceicoccales bacterium]|jgi:phosphatidate cytidylyltransferase|nr:phosphatidate cytidylyltransferase [Puniceicoccales bacterium]
MKKRIFSSIALLIILGGAYKMGSHGVAILIILIGLLTQREFYALLKKTGQKPFVMTGMLGGILLMLGAYISGKAKVLNIFPILPYSEECLAILIAIITVRGLVARSPEISSGIIPTLTGIFIPFMCIFPLKLIVLGNSIFGPNNNSTIAIIFHIIFTAKACDIGGIFAGKYFGRHKLAAKLSPNKTIEGAIGGILCSNIVGMLLAIFFYRHFLPGKASLPILAIVTSTLLAILAMVGDFMESAIKRLAGEKDSGNVLPGMGGIFDLTDSLIFALPFGAIFALHCLI